MAAVVEDSELALFLPEVTESAEPVWLLEEEEEEVKLLGEPVGLQQIHHKARTGGMLF